MRMGKGIIAATVLCAAIDIAHAGKPPGMLTVGQLEHQCKPENGQISQGYCDGYLRGFQEGIMARDLSGFPKRICWTGTTMHTVKKTFMEWAAMHQDNADKDGLAIKVLGTLLRAYHPCDKKP